MKEDVTIDRYTVNVTGHLDKDNKLLYLKSEMPCDDYRGYVSTRMVELEDKVLREALVELGGTPPSDKSKERPTATDKYKHCNHHHELTDKHTLIIIDGQEVVVNNDAMLLIQELNRLGLKTRTHHIAEDCGHPFISILLDNVDISVREVNEKDADRTVYNGKKELLIQWER